MNDTPQLHPNAPPPLSQWMIRGAVVLFDWLRIREPERTACTYELYSIPVHAAWGHGYEQTNMQLSGMLPAPQGFWPLAIHCFYGPMNEKDRENFRSNYTLEFHILNRIFYRCPLIAFPETGIMLNQWANAEDRKLPAQPGEFYDPIPYIPALAPFGVRLTGEPQKVETLAFLPLLVGMLDLPVQ